VVPTWRDNDCSNWNNCSLPPRKQNGPNRYGKILFPKHNRNKREKNLFIVGYRVCKENIATVGETTSFFHQWHELTKLGHQHPNPRRQILNDIRNLVLKAIGEGTDVCIAMDANEDLETKTQLFHKWIAECRLVSVHENLYDEEYYKTHPVPTTYQYGAKKIDHVFCTPRLIGCVTGVAVKPLHDRIFSDHQALIVDFNTEQLLGQPLNISKPKTRLLVSTRKRAMHQYRFELHHRLQAQNIYQQANKLRAQYKTTTTPSQWMDDQTGILDKYITTCMLIAEATIHSHNMDDFSTKKVEAADMEKFWKLALQANRSNASTPTPPMESIMSRHPTMDTEGLDDTPTIIHNL
jgi:hypothetical protein